MLYHVPDLRRALSEVTRVLKPNGTLYAATNGEAHMCELHDLIRRLVPGFRTVAVGFTLENGDPTLRQHFGDVVLRRYEDNLVVPDAQALVAYVNSMATLENATDDQLRTLDNAIAEQIAREGQMFISKDAGLFVCK